MRLCFVFSSDWSTCQLSPNAVCGSGIKTRMLDCVRSDGKSVDIKFCEEVRAAGNSSGVSSGAFPFCSLGRLVLYSLPLTRALYFPNDIITSVITVYYCILPVLLDPQLHEIFRPSCAEIVVVASGRVFYSFIMCPGSCNCSRRAVAERPHSYLTLGPLHHLAHSQNTVSGWVSQQPPYSNSGRPDAFYPPLPEQRPLGILVLRGQAAALQYLLPWLLIRDAMSYTLGVGFLINPSKSAAVYGRSVFQKSLSFLTADNYSLTFSII